MAARRRGLGRRWGMQHPVTPDGRYFVVKARLWRCTDPSLPAAQRAHWVQELMAARRAVRAAAGKAAELQAARQRVHAAKLALGERGPPWWGEEGETYDRCLVKNTPYAAWYAQHHGDGSTGC